MVQNLIRMNKKHCQHFVRGCNPQELGMVTDLGFIVRCRGRGAGQAVFCVGKHINQLAPGLAVKRFEDAALVNYNRVKLRRVELSTIS